MNHLFRRLTFVRNEQRALTGLIALGLLIAAAYVGQGLLLAPALGIIFSNQPWTGVLPFVLGAVILLLIRGWAQGQSETVGAIMSGRIKGAIRSRLYDKLLWLGPGWLGRTRAGVVQSTLVDSVEMSERYFSQLLPRMIISGLSVLALVGYVMTLDRTVGLVVAGCALLALVTPIISAQLLRVRTRFWWEKYFPLNAEYLDNVQGMATLKAFNAARRRGRELATDAEAICVASIRLMWLEALYSCVVGLAIGIGSAVSVGLGALHVAEGTLTAANLLLILLLVSECFRPVRALQQAFHQAFWVTSVTDSIFSLLDATPLVQDPQQSERALPSLRGRGTGGEVLRFENITFAYGADSQPALRNLAFQIGAGERVALVGRSGAGKSTVVNLLLRFYDPQQGRITLGGVDIRDLPLATLRRQIAVVAQETYLFHTTIRNNLRLAKPEATDAEIEAAARSAAIHDFIVGLPNGYATIVGERGMKLSGGERQRVAIARALLKDAPILILDEATSSVDLANEASIQRALTTVMQGRTSLIIAHRLSTIQDADRILVLERGERVEEGAHQTLLHTQGAYAHMVTLQGGVA